MKRIASLIPGNLIAVLTVLFVALLSPASARGQNPCAWSGLDCSHPKTTQRPTNSERENTSEATSASGDSFFEIRRYNGNVSKIRKSYKYSAKGDAAIEKEAWHEAAKFFNEAVKALPTSFNGGTGSDKQQLDVAQRQAAAWAKFAYCNYKLGQRELAISQFEWVADNKYASSEDVKWARRAIVVIQEEVYAIAMEKKKQAALKAQ